MNEQTSPSRFSNDLTPLTAADVVPAGRSASETSCTALRTEGRDRVRATLSTLASHRATKGVALSTLTLTLAACGGGSTGTDTGAGTGTGTGTGTSLTITRSGASYSATPVAGFSLPSSSAATLVVADAPSNAYSILLDADGSGVLEFSFADADDVVTLQAGSTIDGFGTLKVTNGTLDATLADVSDVARVEVASSIILTVQQVISIPVLISNDPLGLIQIQAFTLADIDQLNAVLQSGTTSIFGVQSALSIVPGPNSTLSDANIAAANTQVQNQVEPTSLAPSAPQDPDTGTGGGGSGGTAADPLPTFGLTADQNGNYTIGNQNGDVTISKHAGVYTLVSARGDTATVDASLVNSFIVNGITVHADAYALDGETVTGTGNLDITEMFVDANVNHWAVTGRIAVAGEATPAQLLTLDAVTEVPVDAMQATINEETATQDEVEDVQSAIGENTILAPGAPASAVVPTTTGYQIVDETWESYSLLSLLPLDTSYWYFGETPAVDEYIVDGDGMDPTQVYMLSIVGLYNYLADTGAYGGGWLEPENIKVVQVTGTLDVPVYSWDEIIQQNNWNYSLWYDLYQSAVYSELAGYLFGLPLTGDASDGNSTYTPATINFTLASAGQSIVAHDAVIDLTGTNNYWYGNAQATPLTADLVWGGLDDDDNGVLNDDGVGTYTSPTINVGASGGNKVILKVTADQGSNLDVNGAGSVEITLASAATAYDFGDISATGGVSVAYATGGTLSASTDLGIATLTIATGETLTATAAQLTGKTVTGAGNIAITTLNATAAANLSLITNTGTRTAEVADDVTFTGNLGTFTTTVASSKTLTATASVVDGKTINGAGNVDVTALNATAAANLSLITNTGTRTAEVADDVTFTGNLGTFTTTVAVGKTLTLTAAKATGKTITGGTVVVSDLGTQTEDLDVSSIASTIDLTGAVVASGKTLTATAAQLDGKTITGSGTVAVVGLSATTDLSGLHAGLTVAVGIAANVDISANSNLGSIDSIALASGVNATMTVAQHAKISSAAGTNTVTLTDAFASAALLDAEVETFVLAAGANDVTTTATGQTINANALLDTEVLTLAGAENVTVTLVAGDLTSTSSGNITVTATTGSNVITTGSGNDIVTGGAGADTLTGGAGNDTIDLGGTDAAADVVIFSAFATNGTDTIDNFETTVDHLNLDGVMTGVTDVVAVTDIAAGANELDFIDNEVYVFADGATAAVNGTAGDVITTYTTLAEVAAFLSDALTVGDNAGGGGLNDTVAGDEAVFVINDLVAGLTYVYHFKESGTGIDASAEDVISGTELTLLSVITEDAGLALVAADII